MHLLTDSPQRFKLRGDGNYVPTLPIGLAAADAVIFLDFSASRC
jgi:hypothetical protein